MTMHLEEELKKYAQTDYYGFHMPGHKRQTASPGNPFLCGDFPLASVDVTEIPPFDDLHDPHGILKEEMENAARFYGTKDTIFSVNGSTASNLAAVSASVKRGGRLLAAANCHRSVFHAAELLELQVTKITPGEMIPDVPGPVDVSETKKLLSAQHFDAMIVTSPSYEGVVSDISALAEAAHAQGTVLIVDEAHGAHLSMHPYFPESSVRCGADLTVQSLHKTLPSLTQTSLLHNATGRVKTEELMKWMDIYESSSPSYILMASITSCIHFLQEHREEYFEAYVQKLRKCRRSLQGLRHLKLFEAPCAEPSKIVISAAGTDIKGTQLYDILYQNYHLVAEKAMPGYLLLMTSPADTAEGFERLTKALTEIDESL